MHLAALLLILSAAASPDQFVVVKKSSYLFSAPSMKASKWNVLPQQPHANEIVEVRDDRWVLRLVGEAKDGFVEVERAPGLVSDGHVKSDSGYHCYDSPDGLDGIAVRFFVKSTELLPVTTKVVEEEFADASAVRLLPGVALDEEAMTETGKPVYRTAVNGVKFSMPVPKDALGQSYSPSLEAPVRNEGSTYVARDADLLLDGRKIDWEENAELFAWRIEGADNTTLVTTGTGCAQFRFKVKRGDADDVTDDAGPLGEAHLDDGDGVTDVYVNADSTVYWPSGSVAGKVAQKTGLEKETKAKGDRRCFEFALEHTFGFTAQKKTAPLTLCFDKAAVVDASSAASDEVPNGARKGVR